MKGIRKGVALALLSLMCLTGTGCSLESLGMNIWKGFGYGIGGLPAGIVNNFLSDLLFPPDTTTE